MTIKSNMTTAIIFLALLLNAFFVSAVIVVDAEYVTFYPGEENSVNVGIENNENFDIEDVSIALDLSHVPFTSVGSSVRDLDDLDEDDDDSVIFRIRPSTGIAPGDYDIPYTVKYVNAENNSESFSVNGSFGARVSAKTDLDFSVEARDNAIVGREGQFSIEIINQGLGEVKSVSVQILPSGFELLSGDKIFIGTIDADDSDTATFNVIYRTTNPTVSARITYKDFDNIDRTETINLPLRVYTEEQALQLGLITKSNTGIYISISILILIVWYFWRRARKKRKQREKMVSGR